MTYKAAKKTTFSGEATTNRTVLSRCRSAFIRHTRLLSDVPRGELQLILPMYPGLVTPKCTTKTIIIRFNQCTNYRKYIGATTNIDYI